METNEPMDDNQMLETKCTIAVKTIKTAILQSQYQAVKLINKEQLALYYGVGRISLKILVMDIGGQELLLTLVIDFKMSCPV